MEFKKYHKNNEYFVRQNNSIIINGRSKSLREPTTNKLSISLYYLSKKWGIWVHVPEVPPPPLVTLVLLIICMGITASLSHIRFLGLDLTSQCWRLDWAEAVQEACFLHGEQPARCYPWNFSYQVEHERLS